MNGQMAGATQMNTDLANGESKIWILDDPEAVSYTHLDVYNRQGKDTAMITVILFSVWKNMGYYMVIYLAGCLLYTSTLAHLHDLDTQVPHGLGSAGVLHAL